MVKLGGKAGAILAVVASDGERRADERDGMVS